MELLKLSASAMDVWEHCPSRYVADRLAGRGGQRGSHAATVGSILHRALELYVTTTVMTAEYVKGWPTLRIFLMQAMQEETGDCDTDSDLWKECEPIAKSWLKRRENEWDNFTVLSCEIKKNFTVYDLTDGHTLPFNFIMDRFDQLGEHEYRVVDYKSFSQPIGPDVLHEKIQARVYALAAQIMHPDAERIWVEFDLIRHDKSVATYFTRQDNIDTWNRIRRVCEQIIAQEPDEAPERLNDTCLWCIKKTTCSALQGNIKADGVASYGEDFAAIVDARALLAMQKKAATEALAELDEYILSVLKKNQMEGADTQYTTLKVKRRAFSKITPEIIRNMVGDKLFFAYGSVSMTMPQFKELLEDPELDDTQRYLLEQEVQRGWSNGWIETKEKR